jgi:hypothetical protein
MRIGNLFGNCYYFVNDWFELKKHNLYVRISFEPTNWKIGIEFVRWNFVLLNIPFINICVHWLTKRNDDEKKEN